MDKAAVAICALDRALKDVLSGCVCDDTTCHILTGIKFLAENGALESLEEGHKKVLIIDEEHLKRFLRC